MNVRRYVKRMKRKVMRISYNLFGLKTFPSLAQYTFDVKQLIEQSVGKDVDDFTDDDIKCVALDYAIYRTCRRLCEIHSSFTLLSAIDVHDLTKENY